MSFRSGPWDRISGFENAGEAARARADEDDVACSILGILITFAPVSVCPIYAQPRADSSGIAKLIQVNWGFTPEKDQQIGGLLMWVPMCFVYLTAIIAQLARWFAYPVTRTALTDNTL